jgi:transposase-like protein
MAAELPEDTPEDVQRWTAKRRLALVLSVLKGETSVAEAARKHGLKVAEIEDWRDRLIAGAENSLRSHPRNDEALKDEMIKKLQRKVGVNYKTARLWTLKFRDMLHERLVHLSGVLVAVAAFHGHTSSFLALYHRGLHAKCRAARDLLVSRVEARSRRPC